jgi:integrase
MSLTNTEIRRAKPKATPYKLTDKKGLFLLVQPSGGLLWRFKYRADGVDNSGLAKRVEKKLALGTYPEISLKDARERRDIARKLLADGVDPSAQRQHERAVAKLGATNTFANVAIKCIEKNAREGLAEATLAKRHWFLKLVSRSLGNRPIAEIQPFTILEAVRPLEASGRLETARRTLEFIGQVFRYAVANQLVPFDPTRDLRRALTAPKPKHLAAILEPKKVGELLRAIDGYQGQPITQIALSLSPHVFVRPGELRQAEWKEIDFESAVWRIAAEKMKARQEHAVPLSTQALRLFAAARDLTSGGRYVFPSIRTAASPMSENTVNASLRRLGFTGDDMTAHGFRAMASTLLNESGKWQPDAIERSLAHKDRDQVRAAYHRGAHWDERVQMAQWWSDYLDQLRIDGEIIFSSK